MSSSSYTYMLTDGSYYKFLYMYINWRLLLQVLIHVYELKWFPFHIWISTVSLNQKCYFLWANCCITLWWWQAAMESLKDQPLPKDLCCCQIWTCLVFFLVVCVSLNSYRDAPRQSLQHRMTRRLGQGEASVYPTAAWKLTEATWMRGLQHRMNRHTVGA
jgi:hypothetical protein